MGSHRHRVASILILVIFVIISPLIVSNGDNFYKILLVTTVICIGFPICTFMYRNTDKKYHKFLFYATLLSVLFIGLLVLAGIGCGLGGRMNCPNIIFYILPVLTSIAGLASLVFGYMKGISN